MTELAYDERSVNYSTQNTTLLANGDPSGVGGGNAPLIAGLEVTVTGTGAPVEVEFYAPGMGNTAGLPVSSWFVVTVGAGSPAVNAATSQLCNWTAGYTNAGGTMRRRLVLTNGVTYTFQVGLSAASAITTAFGSVSSGGSTAGVMYLRVTG